jgi:hypothetical protein
VAGPLLLALQILAAEPLPEPPVVIDLIAPVRLLRCPELKPDEIVVCGHRPGEEARLFFRRDPWGRAPKPEREKRGGIRVPF